MAFDITQFCHQVFVAALCCLHTFAALLSACLGGACLASLPSSIKINRAESQRCFDLFCKFAMLSGMSSFYMFARVRSPLCTLTCPAAGTTRQVYLLATSCPEKMAAWPLCIALCNGNIVLEFFVSDEERLLADVFTDALTGWDSLEAEDGSIAADLAEQSGAQGINAMIQRKLAGQPSGLRAQQFDFDPDTGEWIEQDDSGGSHSVFQTQDWLPVTSRLDDSAPLMVPVIPHSTTPDEAVSRRDVPRHITPEAADSLLATSSPISSGAEEHHKSEEFVEVWNMGLRQRGKGQGQSHVAYGDNDLVSQKQKAHGRRDVPRVFDAQAALLSSAVVGAVGVCALGLLFCFECCNI